MKEYEIKNGVEIVYKFHTITLQDAKYIFKYFVDDTNNTRLSYGLSPFQFSLWQAGELIENY